MRTCLLIQSVAGRGTHLHSTMARSQAAVTMRDFVRTLIEQLKHWIARYKVALDYADAKERRRPTSEIEWNGEMIGDLGRRSSDA